MVKYILVVDDEPEFVNSLVNGLGNAARNVSIFTADSARKTVEILRTVFVDLVVLDGKMSVVNGFPLVEYIKREHPKTAVLVMSARDKEAAKKHLDDLRVPELSATSVGSRAALNRTSADGAVGIQPS